MSRICVLACFLLAAFVGGITALESCPPGSYNIMTMNIMNTSTMSCGFCPAGRYSDQPNATDCTTCPTCPTGRTSVPGSSSANACCAGSTAVFLGSEVTVSGTDSSVVDGNCFSSHVGAGVVNYPPNSKCRITTSEAGLLRVDNFDVEADGDQCDSDWDHLSIGGNKYCGTNAPEMVSVVAGESFEWKSDGGAEAKGFKICVTFPLGVARWLHDRFKLF